MFPYTSALIFCPGDTTIEASKDRQTSSSTIEKRNRKKRKRIYVGLGLKQKKDPRVMMMIPKKFGTSFWLKQLLIRDSR